MTTTPILYTKLYIPPLRPSLVARSRLTERLNQGLPGKLTLISASTGFGKTTLVSHWLTSCERQVAWLSLDEADNDSTRFMTYLFAALQSVGASSMEEGLIGLFKSPQPPPIESILAALIQGITTISDPFVLVLDDYHVIHDRQIDHALGYLIEHMPPQMHIVMATRTDPRLSLARLRARGQLTELRAADLRFNSSETTEFLSRETGLSLTAEHISALETRTEGWAAGLQLAAISMQGSSDISSFIESFTGSHRFITDYLMEEVLAQQPEYVQNFLLGTSILDRLCGPLCDAVLSRETDPDHAGPSTGQDTLEYLERANLFLVPLDHERCWYRYHHLFADFLRQRLPEYRQNSYHLRASSWYEEHGLAIEAFHHAVFARDIDRAVHLAEGDGMPLLFRGAVVPVMNWLESLPGKEMDARPSLCVMYASGLLMRGQMSGVEEKLSAAEQVLQAAGQNDKARDLIGHIASIRATVAVSRHQAEVIMAESRRALEYLHPDNLPVRTATIWTLGYAYQLLGDRAGAGKAYAEALSNSQRIGHIMITIMATLGLGIIQESDNQLHAAAETYRLVLDMAGDPPLPAACEAYLGLARLSYEWNDLEGAQELGQRSVELAQQLEQADRVVAGELFLARIKLALGEVSSAAYILAKADQIARQHNFDHQLPRIAAAHVTLLLRQGELKAAAQLAQKHELHLAKARLHLAQGDTTAALSVLMLLRNKAQEKQLHDETLKVMVLQAAVLYVHGDKLAAVKILTEALTMAEPSGFLRIFLDEGSDIERLLCETAAHGIMKVYVGKLLSAFQGEGLKSQVLAPSDHSDRAVQAATLIEPLSGRELEVLRLIAEGLSNLEISERLHIALTTVKGHNRIIFDKLQVSRRTEAVARARALGLL
ncbi:LuxR family transcriptional regulator [Paenibacillus zeisoli]|uniref:LuxR family transcriptional regulator n=2 Tax=Paenibacillus zeisoli TaxID=2496267 RepID=A0A3S1B759_9BACL|nr:LuxR C-terminal-related transcriptional regulator [Paenibacillus zeisoli]RUT29685.1 LuxR family transcriptional regulator [Paenibacillus zeisoli]